MTGVNVRSSLNWGGEIFCWVNWFIGTTGEIVTKLGLFGGRFVVAIVGFVSANRGVDRKVQG